MNLYWTREELKKWSFFIFIGTVLVYSARSALPVVSGTGLSKLSKYVPCGGKWFLPFLTSQKVQIRNKKRYKFDFLTENRFRPRSPLRTWPKNGQQNEIEKLKKFWFEMNLVGIIMNLEKLWVASVMDTWWVRLLVDSWQINLVVQL